MTLGQRIQEGRTKLGLSQEGLGERLGVSRQAVSKWEADAAVPDTDKLIALSKLFGMTLNELLQVEGPAQAEASREETGAGAGSRDEPGQKAARRRRIGRIGHILSAVVFLIFVADLVSLNLEVRRLEGEVSALEGEVSALEAQQGQTGLDPAGPLVADFTFSNYSGVLTLDLLPGQVRAELAVSFTVSGRDGKTKTLPAEAGEGGHYTARLPVSTYGMYAPMTVSALFSDGGETIYPVPLVRITAFSNSAMSWETLWKEE